MHRRDVLKAPLAAAFAGMSRRMERIGLQLYTVRSLLKQDFEGTLREVAAIGFQEVEFAGLHGVAPRAVRETLARLQLDAPAGHVDSTHLKGDWSKSIDEAREVGFRHLICAWTPPEERQSLDDYRRLAELLNRAGEACRNVGLGFGYHNHDFEFAPTGGRIPYQTLLEETDPGLVQMELDLYWITKGNQDPLAYFDEYPGRFLFAHVKDMDGTTARSFADVGRGIIDFKRILPRAERAGIRHFFVEHDEPASPLATARAGFEHLKRLNN